MFLKKSVLILLISVVLLIDGALKSDTIDNEISELINKEFDGSDVLFQSLINPYGYVSYFLILRDLKLFHCLKFFNFFFRFQGTNLKIVMLVFRIFLW